MSVCLDSVQNELILKGHRPQSVIRQGRRRRRRRRKRRNRRRRRRKKQTK
jgi:hypothetical protein